MYFILVDYHLARSGRRFMTPFACDELVVLFFRTTCIDDVNRLFARAQIFDGKRFFIQKLTVEEENEDLMTFEVV